MKFGILINKNLVLRLLTYLKFLSVNLYRNINETHERTLITQVY